MTVDSRIIDLYNEYVHTALPRREFLAKLARRHDVSGLSIGMSSDFQAAVMLGATAVRVGTALFED